MLGWSSVAAIRASRRKCSCSLGVVLLGSKTLIAIRRERCWSILSMFSHGLPAVLTNAPIPGTNALPVLFPTFPARLPYYTRHPAHQVQMMLPGPVLPVPHPIGQAQRGPALYCSMLQYNAHLPPAPGQRPSAPLHVALTRAASFLCYTTRISIPRHTPVHDRMIPGHRRTYAGLPGHFLDYTMHRLVSGQVKARGHKLPMIQQSVAYHANRSPYQTRPSRCLHQAALPVHVALAPHLASSSAAEYSLWYPRVPHYWYPVLRPG